MIGIYIALIEIAIFGILSYNIKKNTNNFNNLNNILYYWISFTILTGIWELSFICNYSSVNKLSENLLKNNTHVWTTNYNIDNILPWRFSQLFYAEYGAYADREYMSKDNWSRVIESSHAILCGIFSLLCLLYKSNGNSKEYLITICISMGSQLMNSILYMFNYFYQTTQKYSVNYSTHSFPTGILLVNRPFMYVNLLWTLCPIYIIIYLIYNNNINDIK